jgi:glycosyltransferase involved in cell wall biosynthesis
LSFAKVAVFALSGKEECFDIRISHWSASTDKNVSKELDAAEGLAALNLGEHPFQSRHSKVTEEELIAVIQNFKPTHVIISRIDLAIYIEKIQEHLNCPIILDLDESASSTGPSILRVIKNPGQALVHKAFFSLIEKLERQTFLVVDQVWVSSKTELGKVQSVCDSLSRTPELFVIPNNVATDQYTQSSEIKKQPNTIIYPASFAYEPTIDAARQLIYEIMPQLPDVHLQFVGSHIPDWMKVLDVHNIVAIGPVPSMVPYLQKAQAMVIPLRAGGGTRLKAVEALAAGLPVISTSFGVEGLGLVPGVDYLEANSSGDFVRQCQDLMSNQELAHSLSSRGLETASRFFSLSALRDNLLTAIKL